MASISIASVPARAGVDFAIHRRLAIAMAVVAASFLLVLMPLSRLESSLLSKLSYPTLTIRTGLPGAAPLDVQNLLTRPIEEAARLIRNVRTVRAISRSGQSDVVLEFVWGTDMDFAAIDVRERLALLHLPLQATRPLLLRLDRSTAPVMRLALVNASEGTSEARLRYLQRFARNRLRPEIESIRGSAAVKVSSGFEDAIHIGGRECIELAIYKEGDANALQLANAIRRKLEALNRMLPADTRLVPVYDQAELMRNAIRRVRHAAIWGGLLSVLVL